MTKKWLISITVVVWAIVGNLIPPSPSAFADGGLADTPWPMFRHNLKHTGKSPYSGPAAPQARWSFQAGSWVFSSPAIDEDGTVYIGANDTQLYAINPDGSEKWHFMSSGAFYSSPAIGSDGTIYAGSYNGRLYAINPDGSEKWNFDTTDLIKSSPAIGDDGTIYIGSSDSNLYAVNPDGTKKWHFPTGNKIYASPAIEDDGTIYISSWDENLYAVFPNGGEKWRFHLGSQPRCSPAIGADGTIYAGSQGTTFYAINPDGTEKWNFSAGGSVSASPAIDDDGTIYVAGGGRLYAIHPDDGTELWRFTASTDSSPAIDADGTIYVGSGQNLYAINPDGTRKWHYNTGDTIQSSPAIGADGTIYVGSNDNKLHAIGAAPGGLMAITDVGVTSEITTADPELLPSEVDRDNAVVFSVNVEDNTPGDPNDDAYSDITVNVGELDVETCAVYKQEQGFLDEVPDVTALPTVSPPGEPAFSRNIANNTVIVRLYVGDPLLGIVSSPQANPGDVDDDGDISAHDASLVLQHVVGLMPFTSEQQVVADVSDDGTISAYDAALILQYTVGLITAFPSENDGMASAVANANSRICPVSLSDISAKPGSKITMPISVLDADSIIAGEMTLSYDSNILRAIGVTTTSLTSGYSLVYEVGDGQVTLSFADAKAIKGSGTVVDVEFEVRPDVPAGTSSLLSLRGVQLNEKPISVTKVDGNLQILPGNSALLQNYPNPFNPETWVPYQLSETANVTITIYNVMGQVVKSLHIERQQAGSYIRKDKACYWDGRNESGEEVGSGVYFYSIQAGSLAATRKMVILR